MECRNPIIPEEVFLHIFQFPYLGRGKPVLPRHRVKSPQGKCIPQFGEDTLLHLSRSLFCEGDAEYILQVGFCVQKQIKITGCKHLGLACTCTGRDNDIVLSICNCSIFLRACKLDYLHRFFFFFRSCFLCRWNRIFIFCKEIPLQIKLPVNIIQALAALSVGAERVERTIGAVFIERRFKLILRCLTYQLFKLLPEAVNRFLRIFRVFLLDTAYRFKTIIPFIGKIAGLYLNALWN